MKVNLYVKLGAIFFLKFYLMAVGITAFILMLISPYVLILGLPGTALSILVPAVLYTGFALLMYKTNLSKLMIQSTGYTCGLIVMLLASLIISAIIFSDLFKENAMLHTCISGVVLPPLILFLYFLYRKKRGITEVIYEDEDFDS